MQKLWKVKSKILIALVFIIISSCGLDDGNTVPLPETDIIEVAMNDADLSSLVAAVDRANLTATLKSAGPYTLLAPSNAAFANFLGQAGFASVADVPVETLKQILLNHVILGVLGSGDLAALQKNYLVNAAAGPTAGTTLVTYLDATDGIQFNGSSKVSKPDVLAANGIIHIVDAVIDLPTIDTFVSVDDNFEDLEAAIDIISPLSALPEMFSESDSGPFTLFAPIGHAFDNLLDTNADWDSVSDIDETLLTAVVTHHVLEGNVRSSDINSGKAFTTLEGDIINFTSIDGNVEITDGAGNGGALIGLFDIQATNGVIHILATKVLLPDTTN